MAKKPKRPQKGAPQNRKDQARGPGGRFKPGTSGNPGGRPKVLAEVRELFREATVDAYDRLCELMAGENEMVAYMAAEAILNRAWGKPTQAVELSGKDGGPIQTVAALEAMTDEQLEQFERTYAAVAAAAAAAAGAAAGGGAADPGAGAGGEAPAGG